MKVETKSAKSFRSVRMSSAASTSSKSFVIAAKYCSGRFSGKWRAIFQIILSVFSRKTTEQDNEENERMTQEKIGFRHEVFFVIVLTHYGPGMGRNFCFKGWTNNDLCIFL